MEKCQFSCYTVVADASLVEEYSVHCITRLFSLFYMICLVYSMISVSVSMKRHTRRKVVWLAVLGLAVQFLLCEFVKQTLVEIFVSDLRGTLSVLIKVRVTRSTVTVHRY